MPVCYITIKSQNGDTIVSDEVMDIFTFMCGTFQFHDAENKRMRTYKVLDRTVNMNCQIITMTVQEIVTQ